MRNRKRSRAGLPVLAGAVALAFAALAACGDPGAEPEEPEELEEAPDAAPAAAAGTQIEIVEYEIPREHERGGDMSCKHLGQIHDVEPRTKGCEECLKTGGRWVHLRMCRSCGKVGCCDSSPNRQATAHFREAGHAIARSMEPGESWSWCYADEVVVLV
ncbi:hypothetical protein BH20GEM1_BH20GEM1_22090 [soil metagenome]